MTGWPHQGSAAYCTWAGSWHGEKGHLMKFLTHYLERAVQLNLAISEPDSALKFSCFN